jgi:hypothetical protein
MGSLKRIAKLEKSIGSEKKMSWLEFIQGDAWPGGPPEWLKDIPCTPPKPLTPYEKEFRVREYIP